MSDDVLNHELLELQHEFIGVLAVCRENCLRLSVERVIETDDGPIRVPPDVICAEIITMIDNLTRKALVTP